jgi:hypothetical protein
LAIRGDVAREVGGIHGRAEDQALLLQPEQARHTPGLCGQLEVGAELRAECAVHRRDEQRQKNPLEGLRRNVSGELERQLGVEENVVLEDARVRGSRQVGEDARSKRRGAQIAPTPPKRLCTARSLKSPVISPPAPVQAGARRHQKMGA